MGPFKCPDCGVWWAGLEHRCQPPVFATSTNKITLRCSCSFDPMGHRITTTARCPIHDAPFTYTTTWPA